MVLDPNPVEMFIPCTKNCFYVKNREKNVIQKTTFRVLQDQSNSIIAIANVLKCSPRIAIHPKSKPETRGRPSKMLESDRTLLIVKNTSSTQRSNHKCQNCSTFSLKNSHRPKSPRKTYEKSTESA